MANNFPATFNRSLDSYTPETCCGCNDVNISIDAMPDSLSVLDPNGNVLTRAADAGNIIKLAEKTGFAVFQGV